MGTKDGRSGEGGFGSCQLAANETSLCRYPNLKGANVLQQHPPHPSQLAPQASSVLQTCASPVCPCIPASAAATRGQLWGPSCDYSHMAAAPLSFERPIAKEEKKCLRYGQYKNPPLTHGQGFFIVQLPRPPTPSCAETLTRHLLQIDASIQWGSLPHLPSVPNFPQRRQARTCSGGLWLGVWWVELHWISEK